MLAPLGPDVATAYELEGVGSVASNPCPPGLGASASEFGGVGSVSNPLGPDVATAYELEGVGSVADAVPKPKGLVAPDDELPNDVGSVLSRFAPFVLVGIASNELSGDVGSVVSELVPPGLVGMSSALTCGSGFVVSIGAAATGGSAVPVPGRVVRRRTVRTCATDERAIGTVLFLETVTRTLLS